MGDTLDDLSEQIRGLENVFGRTIDGIQSQLNVLRYKLDREVRLRDETEARLHRLSKRLDKLDSASPNEPKKPYLSQALTLDIEGLAEIGAPVRHESYSQWRGTLVSLASHTDNHVWVIWRDLTGEVVAPTRHIPDCITLDLTNPIGQNIALRWVSRKLGCEPGIDTYLRFAPVVQKAYGQVEVPSGWALYNNYNDEGNQVHRFHTQDGAQPPPQRRLHLHYVPALANITDSIEALRIVVLHLAGRL